jgi:hypothetical protein
LPPILLLLFAVYFGQAQLFVGLCLRAQASCLAENGSRVLSDQVAAILEKEKAAIREGIRPSFYYPSRKSPEVYQS